MAFENSSNIISNQSSSAGRYTFLTPETQNAHYQSHNDVMLDQLVEILRKLQEWKMDLAVVEILCKGSNDPVTPGDVHGCWLGYHIKDVSNNLSKGNRENGLQCRVGYSFLTQMCTAELRRKEQSLQRLTPELDPTIFMVLHNNNNRLATMAYSKLLHQLFRPRLCYYWSKSVAYVRTIGSGNSERVHKEDREEMYKDCEAPYWNPMMQCDGRSELPDNVWSPYHKEQCDEPSNQAWETYRTYMHCRYWICDCT